MKANLLPIRPSEFSFRVYFFKKAKIHVLGIWLVHQKVFIMDVHGVPTDNISDQYTYLIFVIFLHEQNFWRIKFTSKKCVNYDKIHSKLPIFALLRQNTQ